MAVEVIVCGLVHVDGGAVVALAAALVAARRDDVDGDGLSLALGDDDGGRRSDGETSSIVRETLRGEADLGDQRDALGRGRRNEEGGPKCRGGVHAVLGFFFRVLSSFFLSFLLLLSLLLLLPQNCLHFDE